MLVLSRRLNEKIFIGDIEISVVDIDRGKVRIGIVAPKGILIEREEVRKLRLEREAAERAAQGS